MGLPDWGTAVGAIANKITQFIKGPIEGAKNEIERLTNERNLLTSKDFSASGSRRVTAIDERIKLLESIIKNKAHD